VGIIWSIHKLVKALTYMEIKNSIIIVTGASDGIGREIALDLAREHATLILVARNNDKLSVVKKLAEEKGARKVEIFSVDLTKNDEIKELIAKVSKNHVSIEGLINNAGIWQKKGDLDTISDEEMLAVINTNLVGLISLTKKSLPILRKASEAFIINISSRSGYLAAQGQSIYAATKYGVRGFTEVMREDMKDTNIRVAGIYQGGTNTQMFNKAGENFPEEKLATFIPAKELANVITFLISRPKGIWLPEIRIENK
jgi:short-subunit dehydrogenase